MATTEKKVNGDPGFARSWGVGSVAEVNVETLELVASFEADPSPVESEMKYVIPDPRCPLCMVVAGVVGVPHMTMTVVLIQARRHVGSVAVRLGRQRRRRRRRSPPKTGGGANIVTGLSPGRRNMISQAARCGPWDTNALMNTGPHATQETTRTFRT